MPNLWLEQGLLVDHGHHQNRYNPTRGASQYAKVYCLADEMLIGQRHVESEIRQWYGMVRPFSLLCNVNEIWFELASDGVSMPELQWLLYYLLSSLTGGGVST